MSYRHMRADDPVLLSLYKMAGGSPKVRRVPSVAKIHELANRRIKLGRHVRGYTLVTFAQFVGVAWEHGGMENFKKPPLSHPGLPWPHGRTFP